MARKYQRKGVVRYQYGWADPLVRAMMPDNPSIALERYMDKFEAYIKPFWPFEWKPWDKYEIKYATDGHPIYGNANHNFAFGAALAVCAYDLDDSRFRDNPYYPRDLVDYYREHIRHTRDDWRPQGVGAGIELELLPPPKKIDLAKCKAIRCSSSTWTLIRGEP